MDRFDKLVVIIPAYNPDKKLLGVVSNLKNSGFSNIILVNDGSKAECDSIFKEFLNIVGNSELEGVLLKHSINLGQGRAYKTAFNYYLEHYPDSIGVIQCDADGQHCIDDICKCAELLLKHPDEFILGVRNFDEKGIPFRSRFGNKCTNLVFNIFCGIKIKDTQTGLKGIPCGLVKYLMETPGERFEYATSVLLEVKKRNVYIRQFDIQTIYINDNESSHFNPILDSIRIYSVLIKYIMASLSAFIIDIILFSIFLNIFKTICMDNYILLSNYSAKVFSCMYSFFVNRKLVFSTNSRSIITLFKFAILCIVQASISSFGVSKLHFVMNWNEVFTKIVVDSILFFVSFEVQQKWVFKQKGGLNVN